MVPFLLLVLGLLLIIGIIGERVLLRDPVRASSQLRRRLRQSTRTRR